VGKEGPPSYLNVTASQQDDICVVEKCQVYFREGGRDHSAVEEANSFHSRYEDLIEIRMVAIRCAYIGSFQSVWCPPSHYSLNKQMSVLAPKKKLAIGKQKDGLQLSHLCALILHRDLILLQ